MCQKTAFNTTTWTICGKKILRKFLLCIFVFRLGGQSLVHLGQNRSRLSNRVPKTSPIKRFLWIRIQEEEIGNRAHFSRTVGQKFRRGYQNCNLIVHRSIYRYYLFLSVFSVFEILLNLERKSCHTWHFFSAVFSKLFAKSEDHSGMKCFFQKGFVFLLKVYGKGTKKIAFFCWKIHAGCRNSNLYFQRSIPRIFFDKKVKSLLPLTISNFRPKVSLRLSKKPSPQQRIYLRKYFIEKTSFLWNYFRARRLKIRVFIGKSKQNVQTCPEEQSPKNTFLDKNKKIGNGATSFLIFRRKFLRGLSNLPSSRPD